MAIAYIHPRHCDTRRVQLYVQIHRPRTARAGVHALRSGCAAPRVLARGPPGGAVRPPTRRSVLLLGGLAHPAAAALHSLSRRVYVLPQLRTAVHLVCNSHPYSPLRLHVLWGRALEPQRLSVPQPWVWPTQHAMVCERAVQVAAAGAVAAPAVARTSNPRAPSPPPPAFLLEARNGDVAVRAAFATMAAVCLKEAAT